MINVLFTYIFSNVGNAVAKATCCRERGYYDAICKSLVITCVLVQLNISSLQTGHVICLASQFHCEYCESSRKVIPTIAESRRTEIVDRHAEIVMYVKSNNGTSLTTH